MIIIILEIAVAPSTPLLPASWVNPQGNTFSKAFLTFPPPWNLRDVIVDAYTKDKIKMVGVISLFFPIQF